MQQFSLVSQTRACCSKDKYVSTECVEVSVCLVPQIRVCAAVFGLKTESVEVMAGMLLQSVLNYT